VIAPLRTMLVRCHNEGAGMLKPNFDSRSAIKSYLLLENIERLQYLSVGRNADSTESALPELDELLHEVRCMPIEQSALCEMVKIVDHGTAPDFTRNITPCWFELQIYVFLFIAFLERNRPGVNSIVWSYVAALQLHMVLGFWFENPSGVPKIEAGAELTSKISNLVETCEVDKQFSISPDFEFLTDFVLVGQRPLFSSAKFTYEQYSELLVSCLAANRFANGIYRWLSSDRRELDASMQLQAVGLILTRGHVFRRVLTCLESLDENDVQPSLATPAKREGWIELIFASMEQLTNEIPKIIDSLRSGSDIIRASRGTLLALKNFCTVIVIA
jgi:hypothetical protein